MKYGRKRAGALLLSGAMVLSAMPVLSAGAEGLNGVQPFEDGNWYYWVDGQVDWNYTGLASNEFGWWYIRNGVLDWSYSGLASNEAGWWYVSNGAIDFESTGLAANEAGTWYYQNGRVAFDFTGTVNIDGADYNIVGGQVVEGNLNGVCLGGDGNWYYFVNGQIDRGYTGLASNEYGWWYIKEGILDWSYTGLASNEFGWWYVNNGGIDFSSTGLAANETGTWYYESGRVAFEFTGIANIGGTDYNIVGGQVVEGNLNGVCLGGDGNWYYYVNGQIDRGYTGLASNEFGWWYINNGVLDWSYTGLASNEFGWWYVKDGAIDFGATGLATNESGTWYYQNGRVAFEFTGTVNINDKEYNVVEGMVTVNVLNGICAAEDGSWHYYVNGQIDKSYTGLAFNEAGGWYVKNGDIDFVSTGIASYDSKLWYYRDSKVATDFTGEVVFEGKKYTVVNGVAKEAGNTGEVTGGTYKPGEKATGELEQNGVYLILSSENPEYALTVVESETDRGGYNLVMSKLTGDESQKFKVYRNPENGKYGFFSMKYLDADGTNPDKKWMIGNLGGWLEGTVGNVDNVDITSVSKGLSVTWVLEEGTAGEYTLKVDRTDYNFYLWVPTIEEGANVQAGGTQNVKTTLNFVSPYTKTLENGTYHISLSDDKEAMFSMENASVKDRAKLVVSEKTGGTEQLFDIFCTNEEKGWYIIRNHNSREYMNGINGSNQIGTEVEQIVWNEGDADVRARTWYIQSRGDNTYSIINFNNNQMLTVNGSKVSQGIGNDGSSQKFAITAQETGSETIKPGVYTIGDAVYRFSHTGNGIYNIFAVGKGYCAADGTFANTDVNASTKWKITESNGKYTVQSVSNKMYLGEDGKVVSEAQSLTAANAENSVTSYADRYDLSVFNKLDSSYDGIQIVKRFKTLGLNRDELLDPIPKMNDVENKIATQMSGVLSTSKVVEFTGETVKELNDFMKEHMGEGDKVVTVKLTKDIQVKPVTMNNDNDMGQIRIPSNVVLDGNNKSLIMACDAKDLPAVGIVFYYNHVKNNYVRTTSSHCGVINLVSEIPYEACTLDVVGADNILVKGNRFSGAGLSAVLINDRYNEDGKTDVFYYDPTEYGIIQGNVLSSLGDTVGIHGNASMLLVSDNTITGTYKVGDFVEKDKEEDGYGLMISCLRDQHPIRVEDEVDGPHDIIVKGNTIGNTRSCAMYCLGTYRVYITDNTLMNSWLEGICMDSGCIGTYFKDNTVSGTANKGGLPGVSVDNGIYNIIDHNTVFDNSCVGIKLVRAGFCNVIVNNECNNNNKQQGLVAKSNIGISIEAKHLDEGNKYKDILDENGSDCNVVYNNTVNAGHFNLIAISENDGDKLNNHNVIKYNKLLLNQDKPDYPAIDWSTGSNVVLDNIIQ